MSEKSEPMRADAAASRPQDGLEQLIADFEAAIAEPGGRQRGTCLTCGVDHDNEQRLNRAVLALTLRRLRGLRVTDAAASRAPSEDAKFESKGTAEYTNKAGQQPTEAVVARPPSTQPIPCKDCGHLIFIDTVLPDAEWERLCPDGGVLCGNCIVGRVAVEKDAVIVYARIVSVDDHDAFAQVKNIGLMALAAGARAVPPEGLQEPEHLEACRIRMGRGNFSCCCDDLRAEAAERERKKAAASVFWPPKDAAEEHLYEIRNGVNAEYVDTHVAALKEIWLSACAVPETQEDEQRLFAGRLMDIFDKLQWVRASAGNNYVCPLCGAVSERNGGPGHAEDCERNAIEAEYDRLYPPTGHYKPFPKVSRPAVPVQDAPQADADVCIPSENACICSRGTYGCGTAHKIEPFKMFSGNKFAEEKLQRYLESVRKLEVIARGESPIIPEPEVAVQDAPSQIDETPAWWARCKKDGHQVGIADLRPHAWGFSCVDCEASEQVEVGAHKHPAVQDALTTQLREALIAAHELLNKRQIAWLGAAPMDKTPEYLAWMEQRRVVLSQVEAALRRKAGEGK